ncbi:hypothetical protein [Corynebacterium accolens]|uniref:hypothetical protein n=1 Tax=Corynebacterium accolens TaxID=38284 RepID=UPI00254F3728|nr:hypothetical protein [Corynebacterium accolens]MDK8469768.1 hypothetical protein [Corynebacterium accolens]MDK8674999.1 hypothetical protein [Corynebacterium accolens]
MMASLLLIFALVLGIAGGFLLYYDRTQRATDAQRDTASQQDTDFHHDTDPQRQDTAAGDSDNSAAEQSQGEKPQHNGKDRDTQGDQDTWAELDIWKDQGAPFRAATDTDHTDHTDDTDHADGSDEDAEGAPDTVGTPDAKVVAEPEDEAATESSSSFAAKYSPSPDIESDSSSATSSGRHHRTADDAHRSASDAPRASVSEALSENNVVKGNTTDATTAGPASGADGAGRASSNDSNDTDGTNESVDSAHTAGNTEKAAETGAGSGIHPAAGSAEDTESDADASSEEAGQKGPEEQPEAQAKTKPVGRPRPLIPGTIRRERKNWAETRGFEYMKSDQYLVDEWTRGVASSGAAPKDIVAGNVYGHEMLLMDIDGVNVMAMRTGAASDVVIDFQRFDSQEPEMSEDLLLAMNIEGFEVYSSDRGVTERMVDERVRIALQRMPEVVSALWLETEWVLAQTTKHSRTADWEAMLPPLALLADAARVLPPRSSSVHTIHFEDLDPAREIPAAPVVEAVGGTTSVGQPEFSRPVIQRPEEPLDMPSRTYSETRGPVEHTAIGADEVDAIADGNERPTPDSGSARLPRRQFGEASIFGDTFGSAFGGSFSGGLGDASPGPGKDAAKGMTEDAAKNAAKDTAEGAAKDAAEGSAEGSSTGPSRDSSRGSSRNASGPAAARDKDCQDESGPRQGE